MNIYEFVKDLRNKKVFTVKQSMVIESINIYVKDEIVYKIAIHVDPAVLKKAQKLGLKSEYIIREINERLKLEDKYKKGTFIIIYDCSKDEANVYGGEVSESEQYDRLKSK